MNISSIVVVDKIEGVVPHKLLLVVSLCLSKCIEQLFFKIANIKLRLLEPSVHQMRPSVAKVLEVIYS